MPLSEQNLLVRCLRKATFCCSILERFIEYPVTLAIVLNGAFLGMQAQHQSSNLTESVPQFYPVFEMIFCFVFTTELCVRLGTHGWTFFCMDGWRWNWFDFFLVLMQLTEVIGMLTTDHESS